MSAGLYPNQEIVERFLASVSTGNLAQPFISPADYDVQGLVAHLGTAPGGSTTLTVNVSVSPTSQIAVVSAYSIWTAANVPSITGTAVNTFTTSTTSTVVKNVPYALNYPLPGPSGTSGYVTAQSTATSVETPVVAPPTQNIYQVSGGITVPDAVYNDFNGVSQPASVIHAGDICTIVLGGAAGSAANLGVSLLLQKR